MCIWYMGIHTQYIYIYIFAYTKQGFGILPPIMENHLEKEP